MTPAEIDLMERIKIEVADPETLFVVLRGRVVLFREDLVGKTDDELLAVIRDKLS